MCCHPNKSSKLSFLSCQSSIFHTNEKHRHGSLTGRPAYRMVDERSGEQRLAASQESSQPGPRRPSSQQHVRTTLLSEFDTSPYQELTSPKHPRPLPQHQRTLRPMDRHQILPLPLRPPPPPKTDQHNDPQIHRPYLLRPRYLRHSNPQRHPHPSNRQHAPQPPRQHQRYPHLGRNERPRNPLRLSLAARPRIGQSTPGTPALLAADGG